MNPEYLLPSRLGPIAILLATAAMSCNLLFPSPETEPQPGVPPPAGPADVPATPPAGTLPTAPPAAPSQPTEAASPSIPTGSQSPGWHCEVGEQAVAILVDPFLAEAIQERLIRYKDDLCGEGYAVFETNLAFASPWEVREFLADLKLQDSGRLGGAILIGNLPRAYQWVRLTYSNPDLVPLEEEAISYQFYADLDGVFEASPGYSSPGGHTFSFDMHTGQVDWELWIGVLPMQGSDYEATASALNRYFDKNHDYRQGRVDIPRGFLQISEHFSATSVQEHNEILGWMQSGSYAWIPFSQAANATFSFDSTAGGMSVEEGYTNLSNGLADFFVGDAHGFWGGHGNLSLDWLEENPLGTVFFWSNGCAVGNLDHDPNFISSVLYSATSAVLVAKGTTNNSGGMGTNSEGFFGRNIATAMSSGMSLGEAVVQHVNVPLIDPWSRSREFHYATVIIVGDPSLRLRQ